MIQLNVEEYCHGCSHFDPDVEKESMYADNYFSHTETRIFCEHRKVCRHIMDYLKEKNENSHDKEESDT